MNILESWRDVQEYEGLYQVSTLGNVRSLDRYVSISNGNKRFSKGALMKCRMNDNGYFVVDLHKNSKKKTFRVSRLVAEAFIPNPNKKCCVNHKDGNKLNNKLDNLEWVTHKENSYHAYNAGLSRYFGYTTVIDSCTNHVYFSIKEAAIANNIPYYTCQAYLYGYRKNPTCLKFAS